MFNLLIILAFIIVLIISIIVFFLNSVKKDYKKCCCCFKSIQSQPSIPTTGPIPVPQATPLPPIPPPNANSPSASVTAFWNESEATAIYLDVILQNPNLGTDIQNLQITNSSLFDPSTGTLLTYNINITTPEFPLNTSEVTPSGDNIVWSDPSGPFFASPDLAGNYNGIEIIDNDRIRLLLNLDLRRLLDHDNPIDVPISITNIIASFDDVTNTVTISSADVVLL